MATVGKKLRRAALEHIASIVTRETILGRHRKLVAKKFDRSKSRTTKPVRRPTASPMLIEQILRMARENPTWGYRRIVGALNEFGHALSHQAVKHILEVHGVDPKFTSDFDMIFKSVGIEALKLPPRSPNLNAFAERFVRSIKSECLDRMIFFGEASLRHAVTEYIEHYHQERPHQGKDNLLLYPRNSSNPKPRDGPIRCRERLGGLLKFYSKEAA